MATETLRPNAVGDETSLTDYPSAGDNYDKVDEETPDGDATVVYTTSDTYLRDLYNIAGSSGSDTIQKITAYAASRAASTPDQAGLKIVCKSGTTVAEGSEETVTTSYATYSKEWTLNPDDGEVWSWPDIDSLQIGISLRQSAAATATLVTQVYVEIDYIGAPHIDIDVVAVDSDNSGFLDDTDEAAMIAAKTNYVRRFDIDFDDDVDESDDTWFDNTRTNNPDLGTIRDAIRTSAFQKLTWDDDWSAYLIQLTDVAATIKNFTGEDSTPIYGWIHIHKHPYITGTPQYLCMSYGQDTAIGAYKALGYGCLLRAQGAGHTYNIFWAGGDWTDLNNWYILEPQTGNIFSATGALAESYQTERIFFFKHTEWVYSTAYLRAHFLDVNWDTETVSYNQTIATFDITGTGNILEEPIDVPYTFITTLGLPVRCGKATLSGLGTLSAMGSFLQLGQAALSGAGTLATQAVLTVVGKATLAGIGTLTARGIGVFIGRAILGGVGALSAIGRRVVIGYFFKFADIKDAIVFKDIEDQTEFIEVEDKITFTEVYE